MEHINRIRLQQSLLWHSKTKPEPLTDMEEKRVDHRIAVIAAVLLVLFAGFLYAFDLVGEKGQVAAAAVESRVLEGSGATAEGDVDRAIALIEKNFELSCFSVERYADGERKIMSDITYVSQVGIDRDSGQLLVHEKQLATDVDTKNGRGLTYETSLYSAVMLGSLDARVEQHDNEIVLRCESDSDCFRVHVDQCVSSGFQSGPECRDMRSSFGVTSPNGYDLRESRNKYTLCKDGAVSSVAAAVGDLIAHFQRR